MCVWPARWPVSPGPGWSGLGRRSVAQRLEGGEACERGGEFVSPGPVVGDADEHAAPAAGDAGGDVQQPLAQRLRLASGEVAVQQGGLGPGDQIAGGEGELSQTALIANSRDGKRPTPVCLPQRMRSSTVAWPRWRASSAASCPIGVSVAKAWNRQPLMSVKDSWAPGLGAFAAHDHPHPLGPTGGGQVGKQCRSARPHRRPARRRPSASTAGVHAVSGNATMAC